MKTVKHLILIILFPAVSICVYGQNSKVEQLRAMERLQVQGVLKQDTTIILKMAASNLLVNAPSKTVVDLKMALNALKMGYISYTSYEQQIDTINVIGNIGIVMGLEIVKPAGSLMENVGKTEKRRFTDIWMFENKHWQMIARQATNISIE